MAKRYKTDNRIKLLSVMLFIIFLVCLLIVINKDKLFNKNINEENINNYDNQEELVAEKLENNEVESGVPEEEIKEKQNINKIKEINGYKVIGKIKIDKIKLEDVILDKTTDESIDLGLTKFWGPEMNEMGNFSIGGHNYAIKRSPLFSKLKNLNKEDEFSLIDLKGRTVKYKIYQKSLVDPSDTSCIDQNIDGKREVTLITCEKGAKRRLVLKAREI